MCLNGNCLLHHKVDVNVLHVYRHMRLLYNIVVHFKLYFETINYRACYPNIIK